MLEQNSGKATAITTHKDDDQSSLKAHPNSTAAAAPPLPLPLQPQHHRLCTLHPSIAAARLLQGEQRALNGNCCTRR